MQAYPRHVVLDVAAILYDRRRKDAPVRQIFPSEDREPHVSPDTRTSSLRRALVRALALALTREIERFDAILGLQPPAGECLVWPRVPREFARGSRQRVTAHRLCGRMSRGDRRDQRNRVLFSFIRPSRPVRAYAHDREVELGVWVCTSARARELDEISRRGHRREFWPGSDTANGHCAGER